MLRVGLLVALVVACTLAEPCIFTANQYYSYDDVLNCFRSIPLDDEVKYTTIQTLQRSLQVYAFLDIANASPDPNLPLQVHMLESLDVISKTNYNFAMDFHADLRDLYNQLRDAHTQYYLPTCYQNILIRQGFALVGWGSTPDNYTVSVSPYFPDDLVDWYQSNYQIDVTQYVNYTVTSLNGIPAYDYFLQYANTSLGMSKDVGTRLNFAFTVPEPNPSNPTIQYGYWQQRTHRNPFPSTTDILYELVSPSGATVEVYLPWNFMALANYTGVQSFLKDYYSKSYSPTGEATPSHTVLEYVESHRDAALSPSHDLSFMKISHPRTLERMEEYKQQLLRNTFGDRASEYTFTLLVSSGHLSFYELSDQKTMVMYLDTMEPGRLSGYYPVLVQGFKLAQEKGLTQLIIDLTNNGGGNICLGQSLLAFIQQAGWAGQGQNWGPQDLPLSDFAEQLVNSAVQYNVNNTVWSPGFYENQNDQHIANNDTSYILPGVPHIRGGKLRNYSKLLHINDCGEFGYMIEPGQNFTPENTVIITHGLCGSTCALFSNHMALYDNVRTVVVGGMPGRSPMQYSSFPGLQVLDSGALFGQFLELRQDIAWVSYESDPNSFVPRLLPTTSDFRYCIREIYPPIPKYSNQPMEFSFQQADYHYFNTELFANYPEYVWYKVIEELF